MRDSVLYSLAQAAFAGEPALLMQPTSAVDPVLRPFVKAQVRGAVRVARASTSVPSDEHMLRLAFLKKLGDLPKGVGPDDEPGVREAFESAAKPYEAARRPRYRITGVVAVVVVVACAAGVYLRFRASGEARFLTSPLGVALAEPLTRFSSSNVTAKHEAARKDILTDDVRGQLGAETYGLLEKALDAPSAFGENPGSFDDAAAELGATMGRLDAALEKKKIPALLAAWPFEKDTGPRTVVLFAFQVHRWANVSVGDASTKVVWGYRLDGSSVADEMVGRPPGSEWAYVDLSAVAKYWNELIVPVFRHSTLALTADAPELEPLEKLLRGRIGEELASCAGVDGDTSERLAESLQQRDDRYAQVEKSFKLEIARPHVFQNPTARTELEKMKDDALVAEALKWDDRLREDYAALTKPLEPFAAMQEERWAYRALAPEPRDARVAGTLAALSHARACYRLDVAFVVFDMARTWSRWTAASPEVVALGAWLRELGLPGDDVWMKNGTVNHAELGPALEAVLDRKPDDLQAAARAAYAKSFGHDPQPYQHSVR